MVGGRKTRFLTPLNAKVNRCRALGGVFRIRIAYASGNVWLQGAEPPIAETGLERQNNNATLLPFIYLTGFIPYSWVSHPTALHSRHLAGVLLSSGIIMDGKEPFRNPNSDYFLEHPESCWPAGKFGMDMRDAWTSLPREFNYIKIPLLSGDAFRDDVYYLSTIAQDRAEFLALLKERRDMREKELTGMWNRTFTHLCTYPTALEHKPGDREDGHWPEAMGFARGKSFDTLIAYFASFLPPAERGAAEIEADHSALPKAQTETIALPADTASASRPALLPTPDRRRLKDIARSASPPRPLGGGVRSGRIRKPGPQGPRRSSRLQHKKDPPVHDNDRPLQAGRIPEEAAPPVGKRKSPARADGDELQASAPRAKRRKTDTRDKPAPTASMSVRKRRRTGGDLDSYPPSATVPGGVGTRKGKVDTRGSGLPLAAAVSDGKTRSPGEVDMSGAQRRRRAGQGGKAATNTARTETGIGTRNTVRGSRVAKSRQRHKKT